jgi:hypothetical protein
VYGSPVFAEVLTVAGRGATPKDPATRRRRNVPLAGEWRASPGIGWQHGPVPEPPDGLVQRSRDAWMTWMQSWVAAHWMPLDLPNLRQLVVLFDLVERQAAGVRAAERTELRQLMDNYGITPKGQQDRRWAPPKREDPVEQPDIADVADRYKHLRMVG